MRKSGDLRSTTCVFFLLGVACTGEVKGPLADGPGAGSGGSGSGSGSGSRSGGQAGEATLPDNPDVVSTIALGGLRRLTVTEYDNVLEDLLGDTTRPARNFLPQDDRTPFDNDLVAQAPSGALVDGLESLATDVAGRFVRDTARRTRILGCQPTSAGDAACMGRFVRSFGRRALRRPLSNDEVSRFLGLQSYGVEDNDFNVGLETVVQAFLQHPEFLYRPEIGTPVTGRSDIVRLDNWQVMTRISFFLWGAGPDDLALDAAQAADTASSFLGADEIRSQVERMLADPRARRNVERFHALWLGYDRLGLAAALATDMRAETAALLGRVVFERKQPWRDLFLATETFLTPALARHYGLPAPSAARWVSYGTTGRAGILSHGTFLSNGAGANDTSPTLRGLAVRTRLLCQTIAPPPPEVDVDSIPINGTCKWDKMAPYRAPSCLACHRQMDPIGWGLENYDQLGRYRQADVDGCDLTERTESEVPGLAGKFRGPGQLGQLVAPTDELKKCATQQLYQFAMGRPATEPEDAAFVDQVLQDLSGDFRFMDLLASFVSSDAFVHRKL